MKYVSEDVEKLPGYQDLFAAVRRELARRRESQPDRRPALEDELRELGDKVSGWTLSLGNPKLSPSVRAELEGELDRTVARQQHIQQELARDQAADGRADDVLDVDRVVDALNRLDEVLARGNPSAANVELSMHIDRIDCHADGQVVVRTCKLGALAGAVDLLRAEPAAPAPSDPAAGPAARVAGQRRRPRLRVTEDDLPGVDADEAAWVAADNDRFAGLGPEWFWEDELRLPRRMSWAERHAAEVGELRRRTGWSLRQLAGHFKKSKPTIHRAVLLDEGMVKGREDANR